MDRNKLLLIVYIGFIFSAKAQDTSGLNFKSMFKVNPFSLLDWHNQAFTLAYEKTLSSKAYMPFSAQVEAGPIFANYAFPNEYYRGFKTRFELRYIKKLNPKKLFFVGLNTGYNRVWYKTTMSYSPTGNGSSWSGVHRLKEVEFAKRVNTVNILIGYVKTINPKLVFEIYGGVGTRRTNLKAKTPGYNMLGWQPDNQFDLSGYYTEAGKFNYFNATGGMKFGFKLN